MVNLHCGATDFVPTPQFLRNHPEAIYNMDESGTMPLEPRPPKVVARKGQKKVRYLTSGQKQQTMVIGCGSTTCNFHHQKLSSFIANYSTGVTRPQTQRWVPLFKLHE